MKEVTEEDLKPFNCWGIQTATTWTRWIYRHEIFACVSHINLYLELNFCRANLLEQKLFISGIYRQLLPHIPENISDRGWAATSSRILRCLNLKATKQHLQVALFSEELTMLGAVRDQRKFMLIWKWTIVRLGEGTRKALQYSISKFQRRKRHKKGNGTAYMKTVPSGVHMKSVSQRPTFAVDVLWYDMLTCAWHDMIRQKVLCALFCSNVDGWMWGPAAFWSTN